MVNWKTGMRDLSYVDFTHQLELMPNHYDLWNKHLERGSLLQPYFGKSCKRNSQTER